MSAVADVHTLISTLEKELTFQKCCSPSNRYLQEEKVFWEMDDRMYILFNICGHHTRWGGIPYPIDASELAEKNYISFIDSLYAEKKRLFQTLETSETFKGQFRLERCFDEGRCILMSLPHYPVCIRDLFVGPINELDGKHDMRFNSLRALKEQLPAILKTLTLTDKLLHTDFALRNICLDADNVVRFIDLDSITLMEHPDQFIYYRWYSTPIITEFKLYPFIRSTSELYPLVKDVDAVIEATISEIKETLLRQTAESPIQSVHDNEDEHS